MQRKNVDLPDPDGPTRHRTWPGSISSETPLKNLERAEVLTDPVCLDHRCHLRSPPWNIRECLHYRFFALCVGECLELASGERPRRPFRIVAFDVVLADHENTGHCEVPRNRDHQEWDRLEICTGYVSRSSVEFGTQRHCGHQRSRLEQADQFVAGRWDDHPHRLGKDRSPHRLAPRHSQATDASV